MVWLACLALLQVDYDALVERLGSDDVAVRSAASESLYEAGESARRALDRAARDARPHVRTEGERLLRVLDLRSRLSEPLRRAVPSIEARLAGGGDHVWTKVYLECANLPEGGWVSRDDTEPLAPRAVRGIRSAEEAEAVLFAASGWGSRSAIAAFLEAIGSEDHAIALVAASAVAWLSRGDALPDALRPLLMHERASVRFAALRAVAEACECTFADAVLTSLDYADAVVRRAAADALAEMHTAAAIPALRRCTADDDPVVRAAAALALARLDPYAGRADFARLAADPSEQVRAAAVQGLAVLGDERARLVELLRDPSVRVRDEVAKVANALPVGTLLPLLNSPNEGTRTQALELLMLRDPGESVTALGRALTHTDPSVVRAALKHLTNLDRMGQRPVIRPLVTHPRADVRRAALWYLAGERDRESAAAFRANLQHEDRELRARMIEAIGGVGSSADVPVLMTFLKDPDSSVRLEAAYALGELGAKEAIPDLIRLLDDPDIKSDAATPLIKLKAREATPHIVRTGMISTQLAEAIERGDLDAQVAEKELLAKLDRGVSCAWVCRVLGLLRKTALAPRIRPFLESEDEDIREAAAEALGRIGDRAALAAITKLLADESEDVRRAAARALGGLGDPAAGPALIRALGDGSWNVRSAALEALGELGVREAAVPAAACVRDPQYLVRKGAVELLVRFGAGLALVEPFLDDEHVDVRKAAAEAVAQSGGLEAECLLLRATEDPRNDWAWPLIWLPRSESAVPSLLRMLGRCDAPVLQILSHLESTGVGAHEGQLLALLDSRCAQVRAGALCIVGALELSSARARVIELAGDRLADVREAAVRALRDLKGDGTLGATRARLTDESGDVRGAAAGALGVRGDAASAPALRALLRDPNEDVRDQAIGALGELRDREALPELLAFAAGDHVGSAIAAFDALASIGDDRAVPALVNAQRREGWLGAYAARALVRLGSTAGVERLVTAEPDYRNPELLELNALRRPQAWKRLSAMRLDREISGEAQALARALGAHLGLPVEFPERRPRKVIRQELDAGEPMLEALRCAAMWMRCAVVLEDDRVRFIPEASEGAFWRDWWAAEKGKR